MHKARWQIIFRRWALLNGYGMLAAFGLYFLLPWLLPQAQMMHEWFSPFPCKIQILAGIGSLVAIFAYLCWSGLGGIFSLRHSHVYPPIWVGGFIGCLIFFLLCKLPPLELSVSVSAVFCAGSWPVLVALLFFLLITPIFAAERTFWDRFKKKPRKTPSKGIAPKLGASGTFDADQLRSWIQTESPIDNPLDDRFGYEKIARRIAKRIMSFPESEAPAIALLGPLGSGKSSIIKLVDHHLRKETQPSGVEYSICTLEGWGISNRQGAVRRIVETIVGQLKRQIDCTCIVGVTARMLESLGGESKTLGLAQKLFGVSHSSTDDELAKLDDLLRVQKRKVILCIEDLERNTENALTPQELSGFLDRVRLTSSIGIILASGDSFPDSGNSQYDLARLCKYFEVITPLDTSCTLEVLTAFRRMALEKVDVDPNFSRRWDPHHWPEVGAVYRNNLPEALASLIGSPRNLKAALRETWAAWDQGLRGEIDIDDLLVMNLLRFGAPDYWNWLIAHSQEWHPRYLNLKPDADGFETARQGVKKVIKTESKVSQCYSVLPFLWPGKFTVDSKEVVIRSPESKQSIVAKGPVNYWERLVSCDAGNYEVSDQQVLKDLKCFSSGNDPNGVQLATFFESKSDAYRERVLFFAHDFLGEEHGTFVIQVLTNILEKCGPAYKGVLRDCRQLLNGIKVDPQKQIGEVWGWWQSHFSKYLVKSPEFSLDIMHGFINGVFRDVAEAKGAEFRAEAARGLESFIKKCEKDETARNAALRMNDQLFANIVIGVSEQAKVKLGDHILRVLPSCRDALLGKFIRICEWGSKYDPQKDPALQFREDGLQYVFGNLRSVYDMISQVDVSEVSKAEQSILATGISLRDATRMMADLAKSKVA